MEYKVTAHGRRWRVRWRQDGAVQRRSFATRSEAIAFAAALKAEVESRRHAASLRAGPLAVSAVVARYYERRRRQLQLSTQHHYEQIISKHIGANIGSLSARELADDPSALQDVYDSLPPTTALHAHQILRPAFQHAVDHRGDLYVEASI